MAAIIFLLTLREWTTAERGAVHGQNVTGSVNECYRRTAGMDIANGVLKGQNNARSEEKRYSRPLAPWPGVPYNVAGCLTVQRDAEMRSEARKAAVLKICGSSSVG